MHPYRRPARGDPSPPEPPGGDATRANDLWLGLLFCAAGVVPVAVAAATGAVWDAEATLGLMLFAAGVGILLGQLRKRGTAVASPKRSRRPAPPSMPDPVLLGPAPWLRYAWATALVTVPTALSALGRDLLALPDMVALYLLAIMTVAFRFGRGPSIVAAALSVASYNFFCIPPHYTLAVHDTRHILTFVMMFGVGLIVSELSLRLQRRQQEARSAALRARTEEMRSSLLSAVSHDLRTPLAVITGAASMLRRDDPSVSQAQRVELLDSISEEAERLERLVANLLDMTRLESGALETKREWVPLEEMVGSALGRVEARLGGRTITTDMPGDLPLVSVDPVLVEQVFVNLLENAAKYTPATSAIEIGAQHRPADGAVTIAVRDHGAGLPVGAEDAVFEKFYRGPRNGSAGVGLGLAICRGIVEAHGGTIVAANADGGGALFQVRLPVTGAPPAIPAVPAVASPDGAR